MSTGSKKRSIIEIFLTVAAVTIAGLIVQALVLKPFVVPSGSMLPTLEPTQRILVNRLAYNFEDTEPGDVIVFHPALGADAGDCPGPGSLSRACDTPADQSDPKYYVKRIVATGGDELLIRDGHAIVNGERVPDDFATDCGVSPACDFREPITIPDGYVYVMGDNRGESNDSRFWGPVDEDWIVGKVIGSYWPPSDIGGI